MQSALNHRSKLILTFVDLTKAFDTVPYNLIVDNLERLGCSAQLRRQLGYLMDRPIGRLREGDETFTMTRGVRRGSEEGPMLFNIVFDSILRGLDSINVGFSMVNDRSGSWCLKHIEYADDLCILAESVESTLAALTSLDTALTAHRHEPFLR